MDGNNISEEKRFELFLGIYPSEKILNWTSKSVCRLQREQVLVLGGTSVLGRARTGQLCTRQIVDWSVRDENIIDGLTAAMIALLNPIGEREETIFDVKGLAVQFLVEMLEAVGFPAESLQALSEEAHDQASVLMVIAQASATQVLMTEMSHPHSFVIHQSIAYPQNPHLNDYLIQLAQDVILENQQNLNHLEMQLLDQSASQQLWAASQR